MRSMTGGVLGRQQTSPYPIRRCAAPSPNLEEGGMALSAATRRFRPCDLAPLRLNTIHQQRSLRN
jgi:hypothetical protein